jgi:predicted phosphate transport protein (TIGR00153 family)
MGFKEWIIPQDKVFFNLLEEQAELAVKVAELFQTMIREYSTFDVLIQRMKVMEHEGDELVHQVIQKLHRSFITPIDHEDISKLASLYDDVLDLIDGTANRIFLFKIEKPNEVIKEFVDIIVRQVREVSALTKHIRKINQREIEQKFKAIHTLENEADDLYDFAIVELFKEKDPIKIMIMKDIYDFLEQITDKCEDVCLVIQDVVIKNA